MPRQTKNIFRKENISVGYFYNHIKDRFNLTLASKNVGFERLITDQNLHRPGLALAGFVDLFAFNRVQVLGNTEMRFLQNLSREERLASLNQFFEFQIPCLIITDNNKPQPEILEMSAKYCIPVFRCKHPTTKATYLISDFLEDQFAPRISIHGSFVDVYGVGMLFIGRSGIGKSEVALDLVERGHRLVTDDVVIFTKKGEGIIMGSGTDLVKHFMEIRGIGIIDVRSMFGVRAIRFQKRLEIIIELEVWDDKTEYTRTGLENKTLSYLGVEIPYVKVPIIPGKNITVISEVIALNYLLKHYNYDASKEFKKRLTKKIKDNTDNDHRMVDYFEHDFE
ncbi:MAG: HPr(Ser) kinase/phosphatase [Bacteroidetes bacterium]|nr:HPr(Ser) kinase/phosphatase [Bacteroidota bacterium]MBU1678397.1 HPr(Ser) kinase/phosphatase [Bacteroidota bacterium]MBU2508491.1 HPr(Ser) kinase/phosphatase [Bacteroidota bacterium]